MPFRTRMERDEKRRDNPPRHHTVHQPHVPGMIDTLFKVFHEGLPAARHIRMAVGVVDPVGHERCQFALEKSHILVTRVPAAIQ